MELKAAIFDMDGLLIDSEPLWQEAGKETLQEFGKELTAEQYHSSTGLRTEEWIEHWFHFFGISMQHAPKAVDIIIQKAIEKIDARADLFPGAEHIINFFKEKDFKIAIATSSPLSLAEIVVQKINIPFQFDAITSAEKLPFGKPHPEVYINCALQLGLTGLQCIAFEDSFNGLIAAKAAKMKCVVVPLASDYEHLKWNAADLKLKSLEEFNTGTLLLL
jgi:sugar-phosphatase